MIAVLLSSENSSILSVDLDNEYPTRNSFESYANAENDEPYICAEISEQNYQLIDTFALGDNSSTFNISDFPDLYINGPLMEGRFYSVFVRFFSNRPSVSFLLMQPL